MNIGVTCGESQSSSSEPNRNKSSVLGSRLYSADLCVVIDSRLSLSEHVAFVCLSGCYQLRQAVRCSSEDATRTMVHSSASARQLQDRHACSSVFVRPRPKLPGWRLPTRHRRRCQTIAFCQHSDTGRRSHTIGNRTFAAQHLGSDTVCRLT